MSKSNIVMLYEKKIIIQYSVFKEKVNIKSKSVKYL